MSPVKRQTSARRTVQPPSLTEAHRAEFTIESALEFITPMFGGGVGIDNDRQHIKTPDAVTPVRGASLRGQLRTWWRRACCEALEPEQVRAREKLLWGWASNKNEPARGLVSIHVSTRQEKWSEYGVFDRSGVIAGQTGLAYAAFPLLPKEELAKQGELPGVLHTRTAPFTVRLSLAFPPEPDQNAKNQEKEKNKANPIYRRQAEAAWGKQGNELDSQLQNELWRTWVAFVTFGGLGGRTRRGFGAVRELPGKRASCPAELRDLPVQVPVALKFLGWDDGRCVQMKGTASDPIIVLNEALEKLRQFRQGVGIGRENNGSKVPGKSLWPEGDSIRRISRSAAAKHANATQIDPTVFKFPRAAFGLPIIFHFKDERKGEPEDHTLAPTGDGGKALNRMASPLILRPAPVDDRQYVGVALWVKDDRLNPALCRLHLQPTKGLVRRGASVSGHLNDSERLLVPPIKRPTSKATGAAAVFGPFFDHFKR